SRPDRPLLLLPGMGRPRDTGAREHQRGQRGLGQGHKTAMAGRRVPSQLGQSPSEPLHGTKDQAMATTQGSNRDSLVKPSIYWLLAFIPITLVLEHAGKVPAPVIFFSAALAIVPIASLIVHSTEQVSARTGEAIGGLLNATFGNAPELIIALTALRAGYLDMARASIVGAILANPLLALGVAFFLGGIRHKDQSYNPTAARTYSTMMLLATISLLVPSAFSRFFAPTETIREEQLLNLGISAVLLLAYALYLFFSLKTHPGA